MKWTQVPSPRRCAKQLTAELNSEMECSVCYCETATCNLTCGHSFCFSCVKEWYHKCSEPTCPMCRKTLNFKGLHRLQEKWTEDAKQQKIDDLFGEYLDDMLDGCTWLNFLMFEIEYTQKRLHQISEWDFDKDLFEAVMYDAIQLVISNEDSGYDETKTFEHTLFVPKRPVRKQKGMAAKRKREISFEPAMLEILLFV